MIESILSSSTKEKVLLYLVRNGECYPSELSKLFKIGLISVQKQLQNLENGGIVVSRLYGKVRLYRFNKRYPFLSELKKLIEKVYDFLPNNEKKLFEKRLRPRRSGKPI